MQAPNETVQAKVPDVRGYYRHIYESRPPQHHEWVAGTASPELIQQVWQNKIQPGSRVLEVGCGVGSESVFLAVRGMNVSGVDISPAAIARAERLADIYGVNVDFQVGDVLNLPFTDETFDVVCDQGVFHHMRDDEQAAYAASLARVLKPGGRFLLRCFSDAIPDDAPQPRRISSRQLTTTFLEHFDIEHLERVLSFSTPSRRSPLGWHTIWIKKG